MASPADGRAVPVLPKRTPLRSRVYLVAWIHSSSGSEQVRIRDLSRLGALIEGAAAPPAGSTILLVRGKTTVEARVAWVDSIWFGVEFSEPIEAGFLADHIDPRLKVSAPRWYRREHLQQQTAEDEE